MSIFRTRILWPLVLVALPVAGCGSSSSSKSTQAATTPAAPASANTTAAAAAPAASAVTVSTKQQKKLGAVLAAGPKHLTVYLFESDKGGRSSCSGECAKVWPPVIGQPKASGKAKASALGTVKRSDGKMQVTYKGHPLYFFIKDKDDGDAYGQGSKSFGAGWYVLTPAGKKIDES